ncbi:MAG: DDE-type integrase/transposase/recombinase [Anaerolineae bacterium]
MMSLLSKRELVTVVGPRYRAARRNEKSRILDEFVAATGYERKYAIQVLNHPPTPKPRKKRLKARRYTPQVKEALLKVWRIADGICSKRLVPGLPSLIDALERHDELRLDAETKALLLAISPATADRLVKDDRRQLKRHGRATTKPGTLLKQQIKVRTFADWDDARPGFVEVDLVAHCDDSTAGEFLYTLVLTDIATAWTECVPLLNRSQKAVVAAIEQARQRFPFPLLGIDSDNGSEFINALLLRYCRERKLTFTRSRPYKKNDQAYVEQKNWSVVRHYVGYDRFESATAHRALLTLYAPLRLYLNFFLPDLKLVSKHRVDGKVHKKYDTAKTPYQRVLDSGILDTERRADLQATYRGLNPAALKRQIDALQDTLWQHATVRFSREAA